MTALVQGSKEWLEFRKDKIGASDAPAIMNESPWCTALQLWERKLGLSPDVMSTNSMRRGLELEPKARLCFEKKTGLEMTPKVIMHPLYNWMIASLDGIDYLHRTIVEIKCPGIVDHECARNGDIPKKYYAQLQHQMEVTTLDKAYYFSYLNDYDNVIIKVERDEKYIKDLLEKEQEFYQCLKNFISPKLTDKDYVDILDEEWNETVREYLSVSSCADIEKRLRDKLILMANGRNCKGAGIRINKVIRKGNVDYTRVPELKDIDLEIYRNEPIEFYKITKG